MKRKLSILAAAAAALGSSLVTGPVEAQGPDIRAIPPIVMMLVDTSGSMEKLGNCACRTAACTECLPDCRGATPERNRWNAVTEALTGTYQDYTCSVVDRRTLASSEPDYRYFLPHIAGNWSSQNTDGILDVYRERVRFGLMTFDATSTFLGNGELMTRTNFLARSDNALAAGGYSYGEPKPFSFPGCSEPYMIDNGARNESAPANQGRLVSVGTEATDMRVINDAVQASLSQIRPYGATPIAGLLTDLDYYFANHPDVRRGSLGVGGDPFYECRTRYGILITDGRPNQDMRGAPYFCEAMGNGVGPLGCPYDTPTNLAAKMLAEEDIEGLYVVGFNVDGSNCAGDPSCISRANQAVNELNDIAAAGGTGSALFATDRSSLVAALAAILDRTAPGTTTRTVPAFVNIGVGSAGPTSQLQMNTGFNVAVQEFEPWVGKLERRRIECDGLSPVTRPIEPRDRFHETINAQTTPAPSLSYGQARALLTVTPPSPTQYNAHLANDAIRDEVDDRVSVIPPARGVVLGSWNPSAPTSHFFTDNSALTPAMFGVTTGARVTEILEWTHGLPGTRRENKRLGAIVHSSPVIVGPPQIDSADESFNAFRQRPEVATRPTVMYVGTNDGILHAINVTNYCPADGDPACSSTEAIQVPEGTELWGFVPPLLYPKFNSLLSSHQWMVDGTPVVREMFDARLLGSGVDGNAYRTVLAVGMRQGGNGYVSLDVTDPLDPKFLWQYVDPDFGETYGEPGLAQVRIELSSTLHERGVAILPGGAGNQLPGNCTPAGDAVPGTVAGVPAPRGQRHCWDTTGRALVILDVATGAVLRKWDSSTFPSPLNGSVAVFPGTTGALASRAFFTDADGVIWRLDLSNPDPANWTVRAFHDIFHGMAPDAGQPAYNRPLVSVNQNNELVILQATGDVDHLEDVDAINRVVSVTEKITFDSAGNVVAVEGSLNWEITLDRGEQVTGPLELFDSKVFFGSFVSAPDAVDACQVGYSRIWGVDFLRNQSTDSVTPGSYLPIPMLDSPSGSKVVSLGRTELPTLDNRLIMGVAATRRPTCVQFSEPTETDPYLGTRQTYRVDRTSAPVYELTALLGGRDTAGVDGASIEEFTQVLNPPQAYTNSRAYLPIVE